MVVIASIGHVVLFKYILVRYWDPQPIVNQSLTAPFPLTTTSDQSPRPLTLLHHDTETSDSILILLLCFSFLAFHFWSHFSVLVSLLSCQDPHPIAEIPVWSKIEPLLLPRPLPQPPSEIPTLCYHSPELQPTPETSNTISLPSETSEQPLRSLTTFQSSLFCFSPPALHSCFHIPISVLIFPFLIYCTVSVLLLSCSTFCSTIIH